MKGTARITSHKSGNTLRLMISVQDPNAGDEANLEEALTSAAEASGLKVKRSPTQPA